MIGIVFDCDGTLIDSEAAHWKSWHLALRDQGRVLTEQDYPNYSGQSGPYIAGKLCEHHELDSPEALLNEKQRHFKQLQREGIPPIERTVKFVRQLAEQKAALGLKLGVASAAHREELLISLKNLGIFHVFDAIVSGHDDLTDYHDPEGVNKPKPYIYLHVAKLLGLMPSQCVAFEDTGPGVQSAVSAGFLTFAVPNAFTKTHDFSKADFVIPSHQELELDDFFKKTEHLWPK